MTLILPCEYEIFEPALDVAEFIMGFSQPGQSTEYGFFTTRLESRISIFGRQSSLPFFMQITAVTNCFKIQFDIK